MRRINKRYIAASYKRAFLFYSALDYSICQYFWAPLLIFFEGVKFLHGFIHKLELRLPIHSCSRRAQIGMGRKMFKSIGFVPAGTKSLPTNPSLKVTKKLFNSKSIKAGEFCFC